MIQGAKELLKQTSLYMKRGDKMSRLKLGGSKDLTTGNPMKLILNFGVPLLFLHQLLIFLLPQKIFFLISK